MIQRRKTVFCKSARFWVVIPLSEYLIVKNADRCSYDMHYKTILKMILRRLRVFCKSAILWVVIGLREVFTLTAPKYRCNDKHHTTS